MRDRGEESIQVGEAEVTDRHMGKRGCVYTAFFLQRETRRHHVMKRTAAQESLPTPRTGGPDLGIQILFIHL